MKKFGKWSEQSDTRFRSGDNKEVTLSPQTTLPGASVNVTLPTPASGTTEFIVGRTSTDTLINKTLTSPAISTISNSGTLTLPTSTDTLVGRATTDTLTNKTFDVDGTGNSLSNIADSNIKDAAGILLDKLQALNGSIVPVTDVDGFLISTGVTTAELNSLSTISGSAVGTEGVQAITGIKTFTAPEISDGSYVLYNAGAETRWEESSGGANYVGLKAPAAITTDVVWTLPDADGASGQVLSTTGAGVLQWAAALTSTLAEDSILIGDNANNTAATDTAAQGDVLANDATGLTIKASAVTNAMLAGSITDAKLNTISTAGKVSGTAITSGDITTSGYFRSTSASDSYFTGNVGIGTASPDRLLHAQYTAQSVRHLDSSPTSFLFEGEDAGIQILANSTGNRGAALTCSSGALSWTFHNTGTDKSNRLEIGTRTSAGNEDIPFLATPVITALTNGNVGIGTTSPDALLDVEAPTGEAVIRLKAATGTQTMDLTTDSSFGVRMETAFNLGFGKTTGDGLVILPSGNVGIGTTSPGGILEVASGDYLFGDKWPDNFGRVAGRSVLQYDGQPYLYLYNSSTIGAGKGGAIRLSAQAIASSNHTFSEIFGGKVNSTSGNFASFLEFKTNTSGGTLNTAIYINEDQEVGIGTTSPNVALDVIGSIEYTGTITDVSDERYKQNITSLTNGLVLINQLSGRRFDWRNEEFPEKKFKQGADVGFIAQEVEAVFPELVKTSADGFKSMEYNKLIAPMVEAIKELSARLEVLEGN